MQKTVPTTIAILLCVLGIGVGYTLGAKQVTRVEIVQNPAQNAMHMMPDGGMMTNNHTTSMADMMHSMNAALEGKAGDAFDRAFIDEMIVHHEGAVNMAELALTNAKHQEIIDLANAIITAQENEIGQMKQWRAMWYGAQ